MNQPFDIKDLFKRAKCIFLNTKNYLKSSEFKSAAKMIVSSAAVGAVVGALGSFTLTGTLGGAVGGAFMSGLCSPSRYRVAPVPLKLRPGIGGGAMGVITTTALTTPLGANGGDAALLAGSVSIAAIVGAELIEEWHYRQSCNRKCRRKNLAKHSPR